MDVLHTILPDDMRHLRSLPGIAPVIGPWLRVDEAYAGQMALRRRLLETDRSAVLQMQSMAREACNELLQCVCNDLPDLGFVCEGGAWICPDGVRVVPSGAPLLDLGRLLQADFCILQRPAGAAEHVLTAAVLCFPASWCLTEKIGRPLMRIHRPVEEYDEGLGRRVQRLFDGVQEGRPLWRFNRLLYANANLHQPRSELAPRTPARAAENYLRCERQVIFRLPRTRAVVFSIHSYVFRRQNVVGLC